MKFLPENKRKTYIYSALLLFSVCGIIYMNFFQGGDAAPVDPQQVEQTLQQGQIAASQGSFAQPSNGSPAGGTPSTAAIQPGNLLPFGVKLDDAVLKSEKFQALKASPAVQVNPDELGKNDLFAR